MRKIVSMAIAFVASALSMVSCADNNASAKWIQKMK